MPAEPTGSPHFPQAVGAIQSTPIPILEQYLAELDAAKLRWVQTDIPARIALIETVQRDLLAVMPEWINASLEAKGLRPDETAAGDEWGVASIIFRLLHGLKQTLRAIDRSGKPQLSAPLRVDDRGQVIARVFPNTLLDRAFFAGVTADVWMEPGKNLDESEATLGEIYRRVPGSGKIALVLGAGNISSLAPADLLHKLFNENQVVILKMNPVNGYVGPLIERGFRALVEMGALRVVYGGVDVAQYLIHHHLVDSLHVTGSDKTYEAIVFGPGTEGARRKAQRQPLVTKPFSAELGNVTPVIIVPGPWSTHDLEAQARSVAYMLVVNAGFNCLTSRLVVQHAGWNQRDAFNRALGRMLSEIPIRPAYYPGAHERYEAFLQAHPDAHQFGTQIDGRLPWTYITDVPAESDDICFRTEAFCSLMAETALAADSIEDYLEKAVDFVNECVWGTLTVALLVHPKSLRDPKIAAAVERALARLRYGTVHL
ncbi:MAG: aldehyde dehydrogenase family protein, partial [Anaerolineae bacterium]|nr:aldehyde dehydrogenase family protein [Anaerolineae bacterium]